jgi:hypothetical protein
MTRRVLIVFLASVLLLSLEGCAMLRPISRASMSIPEAAPVWERMNEAAWICRVRLDSPPLVVHAIKIDLKTPGLQIAVYPKIPLSGATNGSLSKKVSTFARENGCFAAVNANPFAPSGTVEGAPRTITGVLVANGARISKPDADYAAALFGGDGPPKVWLANQADIVTSSIPWTYREQVFDNAVGGFFFALKNGVVSVDRPGRAAASKRYPRTAVGLTADGNTLIFMAVDGKTRESGGATEEETARWMRYFGAWNAITLDGGGSSTMAISDGAGVVRLENTPVDTIFPGVERAVGSCLGFTLSK